MIVHCHFCCSRAIPGLMVGVRVKDIQLRASYYGLFAQERLHHRVSMLTGEELHNFCILLGQVAEY